MEALVTADTDDQHKFGIFSGLLTNRILDHLF